MLAKGDLKFRLKGKRLQGDFALVHMKARRPGSKGNEWLLIKKKDDAVVPGFDIDKYDTSVLTGRTMKQIGGDKGSAEWTSSPPASRGTVKAAWLADAISRADKKRKTSTVETATAEETSLKKKDQKKPSSATTSDNGNKRGSRKNSSVSSIVGNLPGAVAKPMPSSVRPMLATSIEEPFDNPEWLFEIKWDGYQIGRAHV